MSQNNQNGFSPIAIVITVTVVLLVALVAWRVWDANQQAQQNNSSSSNQQSANQESINNQNGEQPEIDPNKGYVVIKEWGVRFKPVDGLTGIIYGIGVQNLPDENATFSTEALTAYGASCSAQAGSRQPLGWLTRTKSAKQEQTSTSGAFTKKIGDYYYQYFTPQTACSDSSQTANQLQTQTLSSQFKPSIGSLEAAK